MPAMFAGDNVAWSGMEDDCLKWMKNSARVWSCERSRVYHEAAS